MIVKETNRYLVEIKCPFCNSEYPDSEITRPLGNTDFVRKECKFCGETFFWKRETTTEYRIAIEE